MKKLRITIQGISYDVEVEVLADDDDTSGYGHAATNLYSPTPTVPSSAPMPRATPAATTAGGPKTLTAPLPGVIKEVKVKVGESVKTNAPVIIMEAMKMETVISSTLDGVIKEIKVKPAQSVQQGEILVTFE
jgi:biotin carboxyl carrier protein